jgi:hypothetical protein
MKMSNNPLPDSRLDSVFDIIAGLRRQMLNTEDSAGQQRIWEVIKNYQNKIRAGEVVVPKF